MMRNQITHELTSLSRAMSEKNSLKLLVYVQVTWRQYTEPPACSLECAGREKVKNIGLKAVLKRLLLAQKWS